MFREGDNTVFQRVTGGLRKPILRFVLASGRPVELLAFHLEPGWAIGAESPRPIAEEVVRRLYPNERPLFIDDPDQVTDSAWLCVAYLCSDKPTQTDDAASNYSVLLVCGLVRNISAGVRGIVCELLARVEWETAAANDFMW